MDLVLIILEYILVCFVLAFLFLVLSGGGVYIACIASLLVCTLYTFLFFKNQKTRKFKLTKQAKQVRLAVITLYVIVTAIGWTIYEPGLKNQTIFGIMLAPEKLLFNTLPTPKGYEFFEYAVVSLYLLPKFLFIALIVVSLQYVLKKINKI